MKTKLLSFAVLILLLFSCSKDEIEPEPVFEIAAGGDKLQIDDFSVQLDAQLDSTQRGLWNIVSGLVDEKVYFDDKDDPKTIFHGLPGEQYQLEWSVRLKQKLSRDTITISFKPLETQITDESLDFYTSRRHLTATKYDRGKWIVEGDDYLRIWDQNFGGRVIPDEQSNNVKILGYQDKSYRIIWETWYGSVSARDTLYFESQKHHQYEALESLHVLGNPYYYKLDDMGNVVELNLAADIKGTIFDQFATHPSLRALVHLKRLSLAGDLLYESPEVITTYYTQLEYLNLSGNYLQKLPDNMGNLKKLDTLLLDNMQGGYTLSRLPESFGHMESLRYLEMSRMGIESLPESFANLTNLEYLDLESNPIEALPREFGNLKKLKTFRGPALKTNLPESFSNLERLEFVFFHLDNDNPRLPENIGDLDNLETLWIFADLHQLPASITDLEKIKDLEFTGGQQGLLRLPEDIGNLRTLEVLRLHGSFKTLPNSIGNLNNLRFLHISGALEELPPSIVELEQLESLDLYAMNIKALPENMHRMKNLSRIVLGHNRLETIPEDLGNMEGLIDLDLSYNRLSAYPESFLNLADQLKRLYINGNEFTFEQLQELGEKLPNLIYKDFD